MLRATANASFWDSLSVVLGEVLKMLENQSAQQRPAAFGAAHGERAPVSWAKISVAAFGGTGVSDCAVGNTARDTSGSNPSLSATRPALGTCQYRGMGSVLTWRSSFCWTRHSSPPSAQRSLILPLRFAMSGTLSSLWLARPLDCDVRIPDASAGASPEASPEPDTEWRRLPSSADGPRRAQEVEAKIAAACAAVPTLAILDNLETP